MALHQVGYRVAQVLALTGSAWLSGRNTTTYFTDFVIRDRSTLLMTKHVFLGNIAALSMNAVPALVRSHNEDNLSPKLLVRQWRNVYEAGKSQNQPVAGFTAAAFLYLAWSVRATGPPLRLAYNAPGLYCTAAILTLSIIPYTIVAMRPTNGALLKIAKSADELSDRVKAEGFELLDRWTNLNGVRSLLPLAGGILGIIAATL